LELSFDAGRHYEWLLAQTSGGILSFSKDKFLVDAAALGLDSGSFELTQQGDSLFLTYAPVPEPSVAAMLGIAAMAVFIGARLRKCRR